MYILFRIANEYDQPEHDFVCAWKDKPTLNELAASMSMEFPESNDEDTLAIVNIWKGEKVRCGHYYCFLVQVGFGESFW